MSKQIDKICVVTSTRADYGLLKFLMKEIKDSKNFKLQIIATGMHLSEEFGMSYREIEKDGLKINSKIDCLLSSDSESAAIKSIGLGLIGFADSLTLLNPDLIILFR